MACRPDLICPDLLEKENDVVQEIADEYDVPTDPVMLLPEMARAWIFDCEVLPMPSTTMMHDQKPIVFFKSLNGAPAVKCTWMPLFNVGNLWFVETFSTTASVEMLGQLVPAAQPRKIKTARMIIEWGAIGRMYEVIRFEDGSILTTYTAREHDGNIRMCGRYKEADADEQTPETVFFTQTRFPCKFCFLAGITCNCSKDVKLQSGVGGVAEHHNFWHRTALQWKEGRSYLAKALNQSVGHADLKLCSTLGGKSKLLFSGSGFTIQYYSVGANFRELDHAAEEYAAHVVYKSYTPLKELPFLNAINSTQREHSQNMLSSYESRSFSQSREDETDLDFLSAAELFGTGTLKKDHQKRRQMTGHSPVSTNYRSGFASGDVLELKGDMLDLDTRLDHEDEEVYDENTGYQSKTMAIMGTLSTEQLSCAETDQFSDLALAGARKNAGAKKSSNAFPCERCGKTFERRYDLRRHVTTVHDKVRAFNCSHCDMSFLQRSHLKEHISSVHEKTFSVTCDVCQLQFTSKSRLMRHHKAVHLRLRPFRCDECDCSYFQRTDLKKHQIAKHGKEPTLAGTTVAT